MKRGKQNLLNAKYKIISLSVKYQKKTSPWEEDGRENVGGGMEARGDGDPDPWALHDLQAQMAKIRTGLSSSEFTRQVAGRKRRPRGPVRPLGS